MRLSVHASGEAGLAPEPHSAVEQAGDEQDDQRKQPCVVHRDLGHTSLAAEPKKDGYGGGDDCVVPPTPALADVELTAGLCGDDGAVVETVAIALALDGEIS